MFSQIVYQVPKSKDNIFDHDTNPTFADSINMPQFKYGFNHFIYTTKDKMEITNNIKIKNKKFYYVVNPHEHTIDDYNNDLNSETKKYFKITNNDPKILSRAFYKLWEIILMFNLIPTDGKFSSACLAEGPGSFCQAIIKFREKFSKNFKNDKYHAITLHSEKKSVPPIVGGFIKHYAKEKVQRFMMYQTGSAIKNKDKDGDITKQSTIDDFKKQIGKDGVDLVTADGGFEWLDENMQEQESYKLILGEIVTAISIQANKGNFVLKIYESYTDVTIKYINILQSFYEHVYITKPLMSRSCNSEKYIVCVNFKQDNKKLKVLEQLLEDLNKNNYLINIFPEFNVMKEFANTMTHINIDINNEQLKMINNIIKFINGNNYHGDKYNKYRDAQIESTKQWTKTFYPDKYNNKLKESILTTINNNIKITQTFNNKII
jgi:23S rRNA U2552 (ribose-2'-O)-methylase RlmE/FtsJ